MQPQRCVRTFVKSIMAEQYRTISQPADGLYKDKGSKFLAFAEPVSSVEEAKERLEYYRKEYDDARHVCYAYRILECAPTSDEPYKLERFERSSDDGEPSGTAGRPIMGRLESRDLINVLVVVVRYFGGILLGTGGLIVAYREATADALAHAEIVEREVMYTQTVRFPYERMNDVMRILKNQNARIIRQDWEDGACVIECECANHITIT